MEKEYIKHLREQVNSSVKAYNLALKDKESANNDLLDYADNVITNQKRLIIALQNELRNSSLEK